MKYILNYSYQYNYFDEEEKKNYIQHSDITSFGKWLTSHEAKGKYYLAMRDREEDMAYFTIYVKGSHIKAVKYKLIDEESGEGVNAFIQGFVVRSKEGIKQTKEIILKLPLSKYKEFVLEFMRLTPTLGHEEMINKGDNDAS